MRIKYLGTSPGYHTLIGRKTVWEVGDVKEVTEDEGNVLVENPDWELVEGTKKEKQTVKGKVKEVVLEVNEDE